MSAVDQFLRTLGQSVPQHHVEQLRKILSGDPSVGDPMAALGRLQEDLEGAKVSRADELAMVRLWSSRPRSISRRCYVGR